MPQYHFRARDMEGRSHEGMQVAASEEEVLRTLDASQLVAISIRPQKPARVPKTRSAQPARQASDDVVQRLSALLEGWTSRVKRGSIAMFARQLATLIDTGIPLVRALRSISRDHYDKNLARVIDRVAGDVQKGDSLSTALGNHPQVFDAVFVSLVKTGEASGTLDKIMDQTATYLERAETLKMRVESALRYPIFVFSFAVLVLLVMLLKIVPLFAKIYSQFGVALPLPTRILLRISHIVTSNIVIVAGVGVVGAIVCGRILRSEAGRLWLDRVKLELPLFGPLIQMYAIGRFARTMGLLVASGTQLLYSLKVIRPVPGNKVMEQAIDSVRRQVEQGTSLSAAMGETGAFPEMLVQVTATGEETGQLDRLLGRAAEFYEQRVSASVDGLSSLVEPIAIVLVGGMVGVMLVALYLPIFSLGQAMRAGLTGHH